MPELLSQIIDIALLVAFIAFCWSISNSLQRIAASLGKPASDTRRLPGESASAHG